MNETNSIRERYQWKRVEAPKRWYPKEVGQELVGFYSGKTVRNGTFGQYEVVLISFPPPASFFFPAFQILKFFDLPPPGFACPFPALCRG